MSKAKWNKTQLEVLDITIELWTEISRMKTQRINSDMTDFKNSILKKLGYERMNHGCPFCEKYKAGLGTTSCFGCPIREKEWTDCFHAPYGEYHEVWQNYSKGITEINHSQPKAKKFLKYLKELREFGPFDGITR